jgi:hypothetical protein
MRCAGSPQDGLIDTRPAKRVSRHLMSLGNLMVMRPVELDGSGRAWQAKRQYHGRQ